jgi:phage terminase large subunit
MSEFQQAVDRLKAWREDPRKFVRECLGATPDSWQDDVLAAFPHNPQQVMLACKGPGKTTVLAWLAWNFLATRPHPKIGAVSITSDNLKDGLWSEMSKWQKKSEFLTTVFEWTSTRIFCRESPETWFMSFRTWPRSADTQTLGETLAGLWADYVMFILDEAGGIPVPVLRTAEVISAQAQKPGCEGHIVLAGNTTSTDGCLYEAAVNRRHMWDVTEVTADPDDPKRTPRIPLEHAKAQIAEYGRENPWVMINILAKFPRQALNTLISADEVILAQRRHYPESVYAGMPKIFGIDVARFGDDEIVFWKRQGKASFMPIRMRGLETVFGAAHALRCANEWGADSIQIDTGTFGAAWYDIITNAMSCTYCLPVNFGGKPFHPQRFRNKRAEMLWDTCIAIKEGMALPPVPEMVAGLSSMQYTHTLAGQIQVEEKDQVKARLGRSPDLEDALMCTYAHPVMVRARTVTGVPVELSQLIEGSLHRRSNDSDPFQRFAEEQKRNHG